MKSYRIGLMALLFASGFSAVFGVILQRTPHTGIVDFRIVYLAARCMIEHHDPYSEAEYLRVFQDEGGTVPPDAVERKKFEGAVMAVVYLPSALLVIAPFASLGWGAAYMAWTILTICAFTFACCLIWRVASDSSPPLSALLLGFILANMEVVFAFGNAAGIAVSLCAIAVWCFFTDRSAIAGVGCLAVSLAIKPHDSAAVWLYFLIAGGAYRKRALQSMLVAMGIGIFAVLWTFQVSPHWIPEIRSNLAIVSAHGGIADPGPEGISNGAGGMIVNLQTVFSVFRDDPVFYDPATWLICLPLFIVWVVRTVRSRNSAAETWLGLAAIVPLSMLPIYHRAYDTKLLILAVPACAALWARGGLQRWLGVLTTSAAIVFTSDLPSTIVTMLSRRVPTQPVGVINQIVWVIVTRPVPLILLLMSVFYLWVYVRQFDSTNFKT